MTFATIYTRWINSAGLGLQPPAATGIDELLERLEREEFDLVAIGRSLIVNPTWPQIIRRGVIDELLPYQRDVLTQLI